MFILKTIRNFKRHFQNNFILYLILFSALFIGIIIGSIIIKKIDYSLSKKILEISNPYFKNIGKNIYSIQNVFKSSILNNLFLMIILIFMSFLSVGIVLIPIIIALKGLSLGLSVAVLVDSFGLKGFIASLLGIYPQNIFIIPGLIGIGAIAFSLSIRISRSINKNIFNNINDILNISLIFILSIFIGTLIEGFFSPHILNIVKSISNVV